MVDNPEEVASYLAETLEECGGTVVDVTEQDDGSAFVELDGDDGDVDTTGSGIIVKNGETD